MICSPRSHIVDSRFFSSGYSTEEARQVFCDLRRLQRWLEVEVALALSQAELGVIPVAAARELEKAARLDRLDLEAIRAHGARTGHSLIPLLNAWQHAAPPEAGRYIHFGATTQDIQDTAQTLEIRDILTIIDLAIGVGWYAFGLAVAALIFLILVAERLLHIDERIARWGNR